MTMTRALMVSLLAALAATAGADVWDIQADNDNGIGTDNELIHGSMQVHDLGALSGPTAHDEDWYLLEQKPFSSYEIVVDATSGDLTTPLLLTRLAGDGTTVLQSAVGISALGFSRSLRVVNDSPVPETGELIRVASAGCGTACGPDDVYRIRLRETTGRIARFNNSATQGTVVILQNTSTETVTGTLRFWRANGAQAAAQAFTLAPHGMAIVNTGVIPGLAGTSGSVTLVHDGPYGVLVGKSVALEPATGFSFDSPLAPLVR
jgi:hypothetical protein